MANEASCFPDLTATLPALTVAHGDVDLVYARRHATYGSWTATATMCDYTGDLKPLLEQPFTTVDADGNVCFCGYVDQAYRCCGDYMAWGWDSREIINRLSISYSVGGEARRTAWAEDVGSIAIYGQREAVLGLPTNTLWPTPELYRDRILAEFSQPRPVLHNTYKCDCGRTYLHISGAWRSLAWQSYEESCGLFQSAPNAGARKAFGVGFTSNEIGFHGEYIGSTGDEFEAFDTGEMIVISGAGDPGNNIITTITGFAGNVVSYTSNGIFFDPDDDVHDTHGGMAQFITNQMVCFDVPVVLNAGCYFVDRVISDGSRFEVHTGGIVSENLIGVPVTINGGVAIRIPDNIDEEMPGATVTIKAYAQIVCQAICNDCDETTTVNRVRVKLRKIGDPTDDVRVTLAASCSAAGESALIAGASVGHAFDLFAVDVTNGLSLAPGACGYVRIERTGGPSTTDYFELVGDDDSALVRAQISPDGVNWRTAGYAVAVEGLVTLPLGALALGMMQTWVEANNISIDVAVENITLGGVIFRVPIYRDGGRSLLYEIEQLLALGDPEGGRLRLYIDCENNVLIDKEPSPDGACVVVDCDGYPLDDICAVRAGQWICAPDGTNDVDPVYLDWMEMKVGSKECRVRYVDRQFLLSELGYILHYAGAR